MSKDTDVNIMKDAARLAENCISLESAFNVGAIITKQVDGEEVRIAGGYSREIAGNTHAEECALLKLGHQKTNTEYSELRKLDDCSLGEATGCTVYSTMEPCSTRTSGNRSCSSRLISAKVSKVVIGLKEPDNFVQCEGVRLLTEAGIEVTFVENEEVLSLCEKHNLHLTK